MITRIHSILATTFLTAASFANAASKAPFEVTKLDSGLEIVSISSRKVPLVTIVLVAKAGAMTESKDINGLTHLWEHMFFKGNARLPNQEAFNKRIRDLGIVYNGDTSAETVRYFFTLPSAHLDAGLQFMADAISTPLLEQSELEKERRVVLDEYDRAASHPSFDMRNLQRRLVFGELDYRRDALGARSTIETATREQLLRIRDEVFVPMNSALFVGGDFDPKELPALVKKHFSSWKNPKDWKPLSQPPFQTFPASMDFVMTRNLVQNAQIELLFEGPRARDNLKDTYAADVLIQLLEHKSGKFYKKFQDSGLTFGVSLNYPTQSQAGELTLAAACKPEDAKKVQQLLIAEINEWLKPDYFTKSQLEDVRRRLVIEHKMQLNKVSEYIKSLGFWWSVTGLDYYAGYIENMRKMEIKDLQALVRQYLVNKPHIATVLLSPQDAKTVGLSDTSQELTEKYLKDYQQASSPKASGK